MSKAEENGLENIFEKLRGDAKKINLFATMLNIPVPRKTRALKRIKDLSRLILQDLDVLEEPEA